MKTTLPMLFAVLLSAPLALAQQPAPTPTPGRDHVIYEPRKQDAVIKEMKQHDKELKKKAEEETEAIRAKQKEEKEEAREHAKRLRFDVSGVVKPASPDAFTQAYHFPPVAQYLTGTCWSFSTTSFFESEIYRLHHRKVKLSEIWPVYWEYVRKMQGFAASRGDTPIDEGSESNAVKIAWQNHGVVPEEAYPGVLSADGRHDHSFLIAQLQELGEWMKKNDVWDENEVTALTRVILDRYLGAPPETFTYEGKSYTPKQFMDQVVQLNMDDYVELMSTLKVPFYAKGEYKVPDNWWHSTDYYNVPLDEWYAALKAAVQAGYTVAIGGDVSEPGIVGSANIAVIPSFDVPQDYIDQDSREFRFDNKTSTDDHGIHLVGFTTTPDGHDWFLIKDSARSSRAGTFPGYYFFRDDFVKLKMLTYMLHKDAVKDVLAKFKQ